MTDLKVVPLRGSRVANEEAVKLIEDLLEKVRSGEIRSVAYASVRSDEHISNAFDCWNGDKFTLLAAATLMHDRLVRKCNDD